MDNCVTIRPDIKHAYDVGDTYYTKDGVRVEICSLAYGLKFFSKNPDNLNGCMIHIATEEEVDKMGLSKTCPFSNGKALAKKGPDFFFEMITTENFSRFWGKTIWCWNTSKEDADKGTLWGYRPDQDKPFLVENRNRVVGMRFCSVEDPR